MSETSRKPSSGWTNADPEPIPGSRKKVTVTIFQPRSPNTIYSDTTPEPSCWTADYPL